MDDQGKKRYGRKAFKRGVRRSQYGKKGTKSIFRPLNSYGIKPDPFPRALNTRTKYIYDGVLTSSTTQGAFGADIKLRLNSIWDPDTAITGANNTSVVGHSTFASLYERYIVNSAKVEIAFIDAPADGTVGGVSLNQRSGILSAATIRDVLERSNTYTTAINNTGSQEKRMHFYIQPWSLQGLTKLEWKANKSVHSSEISSNPQDQIYIWVALANASSTTQTTMRVRIRIIYFTTFYNRKQLDSTGI